MFMQKGRVYEVKISLNIRFLALSKLLVNCMTIFLGRNLINNSAVIIRKEKVKVAKEPWHKEFWLH